MKKEISSHAATAKAIRKELKAAFPNQKFTVRAQSYSMGDNVNIDWTNGVSTDKVEEITDKYQEGHFNGMEDIYEYSNRNEDIPQVKFVFTNREISDEVFEGFFKQAKEKYADFENITDINEFLPNYPGTARSFIHATYITGQDLAGL